ncbi:hypothetical protein AAHH67_16210 [Niallia circulans]
MELKNGDVLIIGCISFMIIPYHDTREDIEDTGKFKHCLMDLGTFRDDCWMKDLNDLKIGDVIFGVENDDPDWQPMRIEAIIPREKVKINHQLF